MSALFITVALLTAGAGAISQSEEMGPPAKRSKLGHQRALEPAPPVPTAAGPAEEPCRSRCEGANGEGAAFVEVAAGVGEHGDFDAALLREPGPCTTGLTGPIPQAGAPSRSRLHACRDALIQIANTGNWHAGQSVIGRKGVRVAPEPVGGAANTLTYAGWTYQLDRHGRVTQAGKDGMTEADAANGSPSSGDLRDFVHHIGNAGDDAGHIRANCLGGDSELLNFVPQNAENNRGIQCAIETATKELLVRGRCTLNINIAYDYPPSRDDAVNRNTYYRPTKVTYTVTVGVPGCAQGWPAAHTQVINISFNNP